MGKKGKDKPKDNKPPAKKGNEPPPKPKKIPPPPACFKLDELMKFKELFKAFDEENIDKVPLKFIVIMLRKVGFNPKTEEINELFKMFLEDDLVDTVELHEWYQMIEAKMGWGDDYEAVVTKAFAALAHDDEEETGIANMDVLKEELYTWGEPLLDIEFVDFLKLSTKDKTYNPLTGEFIYGKFIENMNAKDEKFLKEPINFFKLDQKTLAMMAQKKAEEERLEAEKKEQERQAREEARRQRMIEAGLIQE